MVVGRVLQGEDVLAQQFTREACKHARVDCVDESVDRGREMLLSEGERCTGNKSVGDEGE